MWRRSGRGQADCAPVSRCWTGCIHAWTRTLSQPNAAAPRGPRAQRPRDRVSKKQDAYAIVTNWTGRMIRIRCQGSRTRRSSSLDMIIWAPEVAASSRYLLSFASRQSFTFSIGSTQTAASKISAIMAVRSSSVSARPNFRRESTLRISTSTSDDRAIRSCCRAFRIACRGMPSRLRAAPTMVLASMTISADGPRYRRRAPHRSPGR